MRIGIVGSRSFFNYDLLEEVITTTLKNDLSNTIIVSGGAKGADALAEIFADNYKLKKWIFKPDWEKYKKSAGFIRNSEIVDNSDIIFAFWDGKSKGTNHTINLAKKKNKEVIITYF